MTTNSTARCLRAVLFGSLLAIAGCGADPTASDPATSTPTTPPVAAAPDHGALLGAEPFTDIDTRITGVGATAQRLRYRSTSGIDGSGTEVTGTVFTPAGAPPAGGWPIVTVGHGTTGVTDDCAPSRSPDLLGAIDLVLPLLARGYVVAVSDFEGLGTDRPHPYLEPDTAGYNLIDIVPAARSAVPDTSDRWAALGQSQGGQASWSAAELAPEYGKGTTFVGSADLSPPTDLSSVAAPGEKLTTPQQLFLPLIIAGLQVQHPELDPSAYLHGILADNRDKLESCSAQGTKIDVALRLKPADSAPRSDADRSRMAGWLAERALPKRPAGGPMLVTVDGRDNLVLPEWTRDSVEKACARGDVIQLLTRPDGRHADPRDVPDAVEWIAARFAGAPAPNTCANRTGDSPTG